jgi:hypothetical protein
VENKANTVSWLAAVVPTPLLAVAVLCLCVANFGSGAWSRNICLEALKRHGEMPEYLAKLDDLFGHQMPSGNVWIEFKGFNPERGADEGFMTYVYYRGNYAGYPRRVYVSPPSAVVNNGEAMVQQRAVLDQSLTQRLRIHWMVVFSRNEQGKISVNILRTQ